MWFNLLQVIIPDVASSFDSPSFNALHPLSTAAFSCSMAVNALVTFFIVGRIWYLSRDIVKFNPDRTSRPFTAIMNMLLESGITILVAQLIWLVLFQLESLGYAVVSGAFTQIYGFTPTIILIRVALGKSQEGTKPNTVMTKSIAFNHSVNAQNRSGTHSDSYSSGFGVPVSVTGGDISERVASSTAIEKEVTV
ncbi:hypothetical protein D9613_011602 [Agrocybe pediades]|uniref:Uncharacterized protein n=1 Tax=Agrocybe pediades TaxID=84607 RepID=A0A8H4QXS5_9AGAR|nr:hypothetical protein D9613_011602 [Agrocybe pediades]